MNRKERYKTFQHFLEHKRGFSKNSFCLFSLEQKCPETVINSHSISNTNLKKISQSGHVMSIKQNPYGADGCIKYEFEKVGLRKASTFPGFCEGHDSELFSLIDSKSFDFQIENVIVYFYRALCFEFWKKAKALSLMESFSVFDRQLQLDEDKQAMEYGFNLGFNDLYIQILRILNDIRERKYSRYKFMVTQFDCQLPYTFLSTHNFEMYNNLSVDGDDFFDPQPQQSCLLAAIPMEEGTAIMFCWEKGYEKHLNNLLSRIKHATGSLHEFYFQLGLETIENIFFDPNWFALLSAGQKKNIISVLEESVGRTAFGKNWRPFSGMFESLEYKIRIHTNSTKIKLWKQKGKKYPNEINSVREN